MTNPPLGRPSTGQPALGHRLAFSLRHRRPTEILINAWGEGSDGVAHVTPHVNEGEGGGGDTIIDKPL